MVGTNYSMGFEVDPAKLKANNQDHTKWTNPLEVELPRAPNLKIYCLYGHGKETERSYWYAKGEYLSNGVNAEGNAMPVRPPTPCFITFSLANGLSDLTGPTNPLCPLWWLPTRLTDLKVTATRTGRRPSTRSTSRSTGTCGSTVPSRFLRPSLLYVPRPTSVIPPFTFSTDFFSSDVFYSASHPQVRSGVKFGEGDGTVPLLSLGAMCVEGWKRPEWNPAGIKVITREQAHKPEALDLRGGPQTGEHVDLLGSSAVYVSSPLPFWPVLSRSRC